MSAHSLQQDIARFNELRTVFRQAVVEAPSFIPEQIEPVWREMEEIKNRHGGMPPNFVESPKSRVESQSKVAN